MKKTLLSVAAICMLSSSADAQFYYRAGLGYAMPLAGQTIVGSPFDLAPYYSGTVNNGISYNLKSASFSAGLQGYLGLGYMINRNVGIQLDAQAGLSSRTLSVTASNENVYYSNGTSILSNITVDQKAEFPINLVPSMVVKTDGNQWDVYCRMGVALPVNSKIEKTRSITNVPGTGAPTTTVETWEVKSSFSAGLAAAAGFQYNINQSLSVWGEVSMLSMSLYIKEEQLTAFTYNGQSIPVGTLNGTKTINYSRNTTLDTSNFSTRPAYSQPFSHVGINVGIRQTLGSPRKRNIDEDSDKGYFRRRN